MHTIDPAHAAPAHLPPGSRPPSVGMTAAAAATPRPAATAPEPPLPEATAPGAARPPAGPATAGGRAAGAAATPSFFCTRSAALMRRSSSSLMALMGGMTWGVCGGGWKVGCGVGWWGAHFCLQAGGLGARRTGATEKIRGRDLSSCYEGMQSPRPGCAATDRLTYWRRVAANAASSGCPLAAKRLAKSCASVWVGGVRVG